MKKIKNINKKGREAWELIDFLRAVIILLLIVFLIWKFWPQLSKSGQSLVTQGVELVEGIKPVIDETFKLRDPDGKKRVLEAVLAENEICNSENADKLIPIYSKALRESEKEKITDKEFLLSQLRQRLAGCYLLKNNPNAVASLGKRTDNQKDKEFIINKLIEIARSKTTKENVDLARRKAQELFGNDNIPKPIEDELKRLDQLLESLKKIDQNKLKEFETEYKKATDLNSLKALNDKYENFFKENSNIQRIKAYEESIGFNTALEEAKVSGNCKKYEEILRSYTTNTKYKEVYLINRDGIEDRNLPLYAKAHKEIADGCSITKNPIQYYIYMAKVLKEFPNKLEKEKQIISQFDMDCKQNPKDTSYSECDGRRKVIGGRDLYRCYWINDHNDWWSPTQGTDDGSCKSCATIPKDLRSCNAYKKNEINKVNTNDFQWSSLWLGTPSWESQCTNDPCGFSRTGCQVNGEFCKELTVEQAKKSEEGKQMQKLSTQSEAGI